jgi:hypothetical protein
MNTQQQKMWATLTNTDDQNRIWTPQQVLAELQRRHLQRASVNITTQVINQQG